MTTWLADNKDKTVKDAMVAVCHTLAHFLVYPFRLLTPFPNQIGALWKNAPENPNRGKEIKPRKPKAEKENLGRADKKSATKKPVKVDNPSSETEILEDGSDD